MLRMLCSLDFLNTQVIPKSSLNRSAQGIELFINGFYTCLRNKHVHKSFKCCKLSLFILLNENVYLMNCTYFVQKKIQKIF